MQISDDAALREFMARLVGWDNPAAADLALRSLGLAAEHRAELVLCGRGDMVPIAQALHRRTLGADRPFVVCDPRRGTTAASVRSPANYTSGVAAFEAASGGTLCLRTRRLPRDRPALVAQLRGARDDRRGRLARAHHRRAALRSEPPGAHRSCDLAVPRVPAGRARPRPRHAGHTGSGRRAARP